MSDSSSNNNDDDDLSILDELIPDSIDQCLPTIPDTSAIDINSNDHQDEQQLDILRDFLDNKCSSSQEWHEPILFNAYYNHDLFYDKIDIIQYISSDY